MRIHNSRGTALPGAFRLLCAALVFAGAGCTSSPSTVLPPPPPSSSGSMYITDFSTNSVSIYSQNANCNCGPNLLVQGGNTGMSGPAGIAVDSTGSVYVANQNANTIAKYSGSLNGNISPSFTIPAAGSGLNNPIGVAVDGSGKVYVGNSAASGGSSSIEVFAPGATTPSQTITGTATGLSTPGFVTLDSGNDIWVGNLTGNSVEEFANGANGPAAPIATISGSRTLLSRPQGLAFDSSGRLYVAINNGLGFSDAVLVFTPPLGGNQTPSNILCGVNTGVNNPTGLAVNSLGTLFVVNSAFGGNPGYMTIFAANNIGGGTSCTGPFPNSTVGGSNTSLVNPAGVALH